MYKILLVDDHSLVRDGIKSLLSGESNFTIIGEASNGEEAILLTKDLQPDLVICDIRMPKMNGIEAVTQLTSEGVKSKFVMLSMHDSEEYILQSIQAGAHGYLLKDAGKDEVLKAVNSVLEGGKYFSGDVSSILVNNLMGGVKLSDAPLTEEKSVNSEGATLDPTINFNLTKREQQILDKAVAGYSNKEIAEALGISKRTTEVHRFNLMKKLNVKNILDLSKKAKEYGLL